eukprot:CAMPEP_0204341598 /NCGR_PEP_ID=MMETSP0469-20131031/23488_1 /ASSEMBLY_ACC=CAM_ASM_000384 /TAXON_ID=2969 /ORGANISM="Oxyrrhis marina" /LENGTH=109 /DNA_ID=CAMNT_0051326353 /DNA_START=140 /DNA_END=466 /DNA_ORIENTATION=-
MSSCSCRCLVRSRCLRWRSDNPSDSSSDDGRAGGQNEESVSMTWEAARASCRAACRQASTTEELDAPDLASSLAAGTDSGTGGRYGGDAPTGEDPTDCHSSAPSAPGPP